MEKIRVGLIGHKFMGRAHTHAYTDVPIFFDVGLEVEKKVLCANEESVKDAAKRWGWQEYSLDWKDVVNNPDVDLVDIAAPSAIHAQVAIAAAKAMAELDEQNVEPYLIMAASQAALGRIDKARQVGLKIKTLDPEFKTASYAESQPYKEANDREQLTAHLASAGLK